jgi:deoxyribose-phosphate aldolase
MKNILFEEASPQLEAYIHLSHKEDFSEDNLFKVNQAINNGAKGIIILINYKLLKGKDLKEIEKQISEITKLLHVNGCLVKVIIESNFFTFEQFRSTYEICSTANVDYVRFQQK